MSSPSASAPAHYSYVGEARPPIPGATWADGIPGPAPNTPLPGLCKDRPAYIPLDIARSLRTRNYDPDDEDAGWTEYHSRAAIKRRKREQMKSHGLVGPAFTH